MFERLRQAARSVSGTVKAVTDTAQKPLILVNPQDKIRQTFMQAADNIEKMFVASEHNIHAELTSESFIYALSKSENIEPFVRVIFDSFDRAIQTGYTQQLQNIRQIMQSRKQTPIASSIAKDFATSTGAELFVRRVEHLAINPEKLSALKEELEDSGVVTHILNITKEEYKKLLNQNSSPYNPVNTFKLAANVLRQCSKSDSIVSGLSGILERQFSFREMGRTLLKTPKTLHNERITDVCLYLESCSEMIKRSTKTNSRGTTGSSAHIYLLETPQTPEEIREEDEEYALARIRRFGGTVSAIASMLRAFSALGEREMQTRPEQIVLANAYLQSHYVGKTTAFMTLFTRKRPKALEDFAQDILINPKCTTLHETIDEEQLQQSTSMPAMMFKSLRAAYNLLFETSIQTIYDSDTPIYHPRFSDGPKWRNKRLTQHVVNAYMPRRINTLCEELAFLDEASRFIMSPDSPTSAATEKQRRIYNLQRKTVQHLENYSVKKTLSLTLKALDDAKENLKEAIEEEPRQSKLTEQIKRTSETIKILYNHTTGKILEPVSLFHIEEAISSPAVIQQQRRSRL